MTKEKDEILLHEALYQEPLPNGKLRCHLCPHQCLLGDGKVGICRVRINRNGILYTLGYGNLCSLAVDPIEKKPLFHFLPGTEILSLAMQGCNLRCLNCQNWEISQCAPTPRERDTMSPEEVVRQALARRIPSIAFTYTEPTVFFEYVFDTAKIAHEKGLKTVLVSNGYVNEKPLLALCPYLDAANIDLKCFDEEAHLRLTGGRLQPVLDTLKVLKDQGVWLEITNLLVSEFSDDPSLVRKMCRWLVENGFSETPLHFSRFFPRYKLADLPPTPVQSLLQAREVALSAGMKYVYLGNISLENGENTFCPNCRQLVVEREGYTVGLDRIRDGKCSFCGHSLSGVWSD